MDSLVHAMLESHTWDNIEKAITANSTCEAYAVVSDLKWVMNDGVIPERIADPHDADPALNVPC